MDKIYLIYLSTRDIYKYIYRISIGVLYIPAFNIVFAISNRDVLTPEWDIFIYAA